MAASSGTAVDGYRQSPFFQTVHLGGVLVEYILHKVHLQEVISRAEGSKLRETPLSGLVAHLSDVGVAHVAELLGHFKVLLPSVAVLHGPFGTDSKDVIQFFVSDLGQSLGTES